MDYETVIGLEIHAELATKTKLFCDCLNDPFRASEPNLYICPVCLGLPGILPVMNRQAVEWAALVGLALGCEIGWPPKEDPTSPRATLGVVNQRFTKWDRKNYFYPDLPKGYQISQYDLPICHQGKLEIRKQRSESRLIEITRIHLEEDTGKLVHPVGTDYSLIDYNRAGVPLLELVTEPVIHSGEEAAVFAQEYQLVLRTLMVAKADMEKGEMRVEANISVRRKQKTENRKQKLGTKVEVKNLNSFKSVQKAIAYETERQIDALERGEAIIQETRGWDEGRQRTFVQRVKETAADYRYFPEPDLPPVTFRESNQKSKVEHSIDLTALRVAIPELPWERRARYQATGVTTHDAERLVQQRELTNKFDELSEKLASSVSQMNLASWLVNGVFYTSEADFRSTEIHRLLQLLCQGEISLQIAKTIRDRMAKTSQSFDELIQQFTADSQSVSANLETIIATILNNHPQAVADYQTGKTQALGFLIGQVMAAAKGQAEPAAIRIKITQQLQGGQDGPTTIKSK